MIKLYKTVNGVVHYCEAWADNGELVKHWGPLGEHGETSTQKIASGASDDQAIEDALSEARAEGFAEHSSHSEIAVQCPTQAAPLSR